MIINQLIINDHFYMFINQWFIIITYFIFAFLLHFFDNFKLIYLMGLKFTSWKFLKNWKNFKVYLNKNYKNDSIPIPIKIIQLPLSISQKNNILETYTTLVKTNNSEQKLLVPGTATFANVNKNKAVTYIGITWTKPL